MNEEDWTAVLKRLEELAECRGYSRGFDEGWAAAVKYGATK